jgi:hypothetical protein
MKLKNYALLLFVFAGVAVFSSCRMFGCVSGSGKQITTDRQLSSFSKIDLSGAYKLILKQDSVSSLRIVADDNIQDEISTVVSNKELKIKLKGKAYCDPGPITIYASVAQLSAISASGSVEINSEGQLKTGNFNLDLSGASKVNLNLIADVVRTKGSGSTELNLTGQATEHNVDLSGSGNLTAFDFVSGKYNIETSGASHCQINVLNELNVRTSGSGDIEYKGNPKVVNNSQSGSSSIRKVE